MADTRRRATLDRLAKSPWYTPLLLTGIMTIGVGWPLLDGATPVQVATTACMWLAVGAMCGFLLERWLRWAFAIGTLVSIFSQARTEHMLIVAASLPFWVGLFAVAAIRMRPRGVEHALSPVRAGWDDAAARNNANDPSWDQVEKLLRQLDGAGRTMVSLRSHGSRLDVCCPASGDFWLFHTEPGSRRDLLHQGVPVAQQAGDELGVRLGGMNFHYPSGLFVPLDDVLAAAAQFWQDGSRVTKVTWTVGDRHHEVLVPPPLFDFA